MTETVYPDHIGVSEVTSRSFEHMRVETYFEGQPSIMMDEPEGFDIGDPPDLQGRSRGWTPVHAQLAALAGCTSITVRVVARDQSFVFDDLKTKLVSLIDIRGFFFDLDRQPKYEQLSFDLWLKTDEPTKRIEALAMETDRRCPQIGLFRMAKIPMVMNWWVEGQDRPVLSQRFFIDEGPTPAEQLAAEAKS